MIVYEKQVQRVSGQTCPATAKPGVNQTQRKGFVASAETDGSGMVSSVYPMLILSGLLERSTVWSTGSESPTRSGH